MVPVSVRPTAGPALFLQVKGAGAAAGGRRVVLIQGAGAAGRALLLGAAASGRVALVAVPVGGVAAASPLRPRCTAGGGNQQPSESDDEALRQHLMDMVHGGEVLQGQEDLLLRLATTAKEAGDLLDMMMKDDSTPLPDYGSLPDYVREELVMLSTTFTELEGQCELGYAIDTAVVAATRGVKKMAQVFLGRAAAKTLGPYPQTFFFGGDEEAKVFYFGELATTFDILLRDVTRAYLVGRD